MKLFSCLYDFQKIFYVKYYTVELMCGNIFCFNTLISDLCKLIENTFRKYLNISRFKMSVVPFKVSFTHRLDCLYKA